MSTNPYSDDKRLLELLERWQSGEFSRADEQELQALSDSDAFRREAVEGFWSAPEADHAGHLASIRDRLRQRSGGAWRVSYRQILTAVAAMGILVMAVVWLLPGDRASAPIAQETVSQPADSAPIASNLPEPAPAEERKRPSSPAPPPVELPIASGPPVASAPSSRDEAVADKLMAPKPSAVESETVQTSDDLEGVDLRPGNAAPVENQGKRAADKQEAQKKKSSDAYRSAQPAGGWDVFQEYLLRKARLPEAARQNNISGTVRLQFRLDAQDRPIDFKVLRPLGYGCEEAAIQLVRDYRWQRGAPVDIVVDVPFVR